MLDSVRGYLRQLGGRRPKCSVCHRRIDITEASVNYHGKMCHMACVRGNRGV